MKFQNKSLRLKATVNDKSITSDQEQYIRHLLLWVNMRNCKSVSTPMENNLKLNKRETNNDNFPYQQLIGGLMNLAVLTRYFILCKLFESV